MLQEYFQIQSKASTDVDELVSLAGKLSLSETPQEVCVCVCVCLFHICSTLSVCYLLKLAVIYCFYAVGIHMLTISILCSIRE